jgi:hypothetical protein
MPIQADLQLTFMTLGIAGSVTNILTIVYIVKTFDFRCEISEHFQNTFRTLSEHFQNTFRTLSEHFQNTFRTLSEHFENI